VKTARKQLTFWLFAALFLTGNHRTFAESLHVRTFRLPASYATAVTISPGGNIVAKSGEYSKVSWFDGFSRREVTMPEENSYRVYQSRSGQLWCVGQEGVWLFHGTEWSLHPIPEVRNEILNNPLRQLRQITLLPAEVNHLLILLPDKLLDYDATTRHTGVLKSVKDTRLGSFSEIAEAIDGFIWISGTYGVAKIEAPARKVTAQTEWREFILSSTNGVSSLQRPFESPRGVITSAAIPVDSGSRSVVQLDRGQWSNIPVQGEKIRQAWQSWDDILWGYSYNSLFRIEPDGRIHREPTIGSQYDLALETNGVFWTATSEGLVRYAPFLWRTPLELEKFEGIVQSILFDSEGSRMWLSTSDGLVLNDRGQVRIFPWPEEIETSGTAAGTLYELATRRLLVDSGRLQFVFDPASGRFSKVNAPATAPLQIVGQFRDRSVCFWVKEKEKGKMAELERFDGENFSKLPLPTADWNPEEITCFKEMPNGDFWIGSGTGLLHARASSTNAEIFGLEKGLPTDRITAVEEIGDGRIWCGTSARIYELRGQRWIPVFNTLDRVTSIARSSDGIWVSTLGGMHRYYQDSWISYGAGDGLAGTTVYQVKIDPLDRVWAATSRGVFVYHADADPDPPRSYSPIVQEQNPSAGQPTVIVFRGQDKWDYTSPSDLLFSYRLDEGNWTPFSNITSRAFQNLSSGTHTLEAFAMDKNGNKSPVQGKLEFSVIIPWFKDPRLVSVSMVALLITAIFAGYAVLKNFQLKRSYAEVEKIVAQRTGELERANQELLHSQKMRAIGTMAAGIAHDFNNILSIIKGSAQIIESNVEDKDKIRTRVNRIQTVVEQGTSIVKSLLGLGKIEEKKMVPCDLKELLLETKKLLADRFPNSFHIGIEADSELPPVVCSREVIQQMLLNFILNAADAMENKGEVLLKAFATTHLPHDLVAEAQPASQYVVVSVTDRGCGITEENLLRIFEPFFTTKSFSSRRGTGLGLSMVYELAKGMGYGLKVQSRISEGSSFSIIIPANPIQPETKDNRDAGKGRNDSINEVIPAK
jgi:signal transduction histidine kinase